MAAAIFAASCAPEIMTPDQSKLPVASELKAQITVDQESNYVTFSVSNPGVVPIWIFGEELIDGKPGKRYSYTQNGLSLRFREAGEHTVELKAYNANGVSQGSQMLTFSLENTYRDPFDPKPYMKAVANVWAWDYTTDGHFGCGENVANPTGWWKCGANGKEGMGLYDDLLTFDADGNFTMDPGEGGTIYVNWNSGFKPEGHAEEIAAQSDYQAPVEKVTTTYSIENNWNDAGFEEIYLVLPQGQWLSYIPHAKALTDETKYLFVETSTSKIKKNLALIHYSATANNGGSIAWMYSFVPYVKEDGPAEWLAGTDDSGKVWVMDAASAGHLGCGENGDNPTGWWSAAAYEKKDFGMYDDELTFYPDGTYKFSPGKDGLIYVNTGVKSIGAEYNTTGNDFDMPYEGFECKYEFDGETIKIPAGKIFGYVPNDAFLEDGTFYVTEITETTLVGYTFTATGNNGGSIAWQYKFKARDVKEPEASIGGSKFTSGIAEISAGKGAELKVVGIDLSTKWIDPDFFTQKDANTLVFNAVDGDYMVYNLKDWLKVVPMYNGEVASYEKGKAIWIIGEGVAKPKGGSAPGWVTGEAADLPLAKTGANTYQITLHITGPNFKLFGQANWGKEFVGSDYGSLDLGGFLKVNGYDAPVDSDSGNIWSGANFEEGWYVLSVTDNDGKLDMKVDQWKQVQTVYDIEGEGNLWRKATVTPEYWYSPADWSGGIQANAELGTNNSFSATIPDGVGGGEWMAQNKLHGGFKYVSGTKYDFCCTIVASEDMEITIKLTGDPEKDANNQDLPIALHYDKEVKLKADEALTYKVDNLSAEMGSDNFTLIFDFGRSPIGSKINVTDICFQEHKEATVIMKRKGF